MSAIIQAEDIVKRYGSTQALAGISMQVERGEMYGIIGPDGAGKTSLFRILATLLLADGGSASVAGLDVERDYRAIRRLIGYMPGRFSLYQDLTVRENLEFFASIFGTTIENNYSMISDIYSQIEPFGGRKAGALSGGMKQKLALSCALIHAPQVLFLDEPTTGVDPVSRREFWAMLQKLKRQYGITVVVSTPYMDEATLCDRIALMQHGRFISVDTPAGIVGAYHRRLWAVSSDNMHRLPGDLRRIAGVATAFSFGETIHVTLQGEGLASPADLRSALTAMGHGGVAVEPIEPTIEDCFMSLMRDSDGRD